MYNFQGREKPWEAIEFLACKQNHEEPSPTWESPWRFSILPRLSQLGCHGQVLRACFVAARLILTRILLPPPFPPFPRWWRCQCFSKGKERIYAWEQQPFHCQAKNQNPGEEKEKDMERPLDSWCSGSGGGGGGYIAHHHHHCHCHGLSLIMNIEQHFVCEQYCCQRWWYYFLHYCNHWPRLGFSVKVRGDLEGKKQRQCETQ